MGTAQTGSPGMTSGSGQSGSSGMTTGQPGSSGMTTGAGNGSASGQGMSGTSSQSHSGSGSSQSGTMNSDNSGQNEQLSQGTLESVQQQLQQQGFYKNGQVDGKWGPHTQQAVQSFQHAKGLPATGKLDEQTLNALGVHNQGG